MKQYHKHLEDILEKGVVKPAAREGMPGTLSIFGYQTKYDLQEGFPLLTTKKVNFKHIVVELLWFLQGNSNIKYLIDNGCNIWNQDAYNYYTKIASGNSRHLNPIMRANIDGSYSMFTYEQFVEQLKSGNYPSTENYSYTLGDTGEQYPALWREWGDTGKDQIKELIDNLISSPTSRRHILTAWNPETLDDMALHACHAMVQFNCRELSFIDRAVIYEEKFEVTLLPDEQSHEYLDSIRIPKYYLDCQLYQRSADMFLGVPYNIASYALLTEILANICNMVAGEFIHSFGDSHIYDNHKEQVKQLLSRDYSKYPLPKLNIPNVKAMYEDQNIAVFNGGLKHEDITLENYQSYPSIKAKLSTGLK